MKNADNFGSAGLPTKQWQGLWCLLISASLGLFIAVIPHLHSLWNTGSLEYLADTDDVLYAAVARQPVAGSWTVADHHAPVGVDLPTPYSWFQFAPAGWVTGAMGMSPPDFLLVWRVIGGASLGLSLFLLIRDALGARWRGQSRILFALLLTALCLVDPGFREGAPVADVPRILSIMHSAEYVRPNPGEYAQYRVLSPLTGLPFVFLLLWRVLPSKRRDAAGAITVGALLGILINLYFFFWTFAVAFLTTIAAWHLLGWLADFETSTRERHWCETRFYVLALLVGLTIGAPQLLMSMNAAKAPAATEALERTPRVIKLDPENPMRRMYLVNKPLVVAITIGLIGASLLRTPALWTLLVACVLATALQGSAVLTGIEFENYKWGHVANTTGYLIICLVIADLVSRISWLRSAGIRYLCVQVFGLGLIAFIFTWREAAETRESNWISRLNQEMRPIRPALWNLNPGSRIAGPPELMVAGLYARAGILYGEHSFQSLISDAELSERFALSHWVMGTSQADMSQDYPAGLPRDGRVFGEERSRWRPASVKEQIQKYYRAFTEADLDRYAVAAVLLPTGKEPSARSGHWKQASRTERWCLWIR